MTADVVRARATRSPRLGEVFDPRRNALNALRLVLASLVIVSHAWPISGNGPDPEIGGQTLGTWAVAGFFLVSGFLITRSRLRSDPVRYYRARFLRIYPGYLVAMAVTAFVAAPLSVLVTGADYPPGDAVSWWVHNLPLYEQHVVQFSIGETLVGQPYPVWNGPVWSLFFEAVCYVVVGVAVSVLPRRALPAAYGAAAVGLTGLTALVVQERIVVEPIYTIALPAVTAFAVGGCAYLARDLLPAGGRAAAWSTVALVVVVAAGQAPVLGAWALALPTFWLAAAATSLHRVGTRHDISYGIYIYGWPVQQLIVIVSRDRGWDVPVPLAIVVALAVTAGLAWASALLVEEPAQRLGRRLDRPAGRRRAAQPTG